MGKPNGKRPLDGFKNRWKDDIKMYFKEVGWEGVDWIYLAQDRHNWQAFVKQLTTLGGLWTFNSLLQCADIL